MRHIDKTVHSCDRSHKVHGKVEQVEEDSAGYNAAAGDSGRSDGHDGGDADYHCDLACRKSESVDLCNKECEDGLIDCSTAKVDGCAERDGEGCDGVGNAETLGGNIHGDRDGACGGVGSDGVDKDRYHCFAHLAKTDFGIKLNDHTEDEEGEQAAGVVGENELCKVAEKLRSVNGGGVCHKSKYADGGVDHNDVKHLIDYVCGLTHEIGNSLSLFAEEYERNSKDQGEEDHLHDILICHGGNDVGGYHVKQECAEIGGGKLGRIVCRKGAGVKSNAGMDNIDNADTDDTGDNGHYNVYNNYLCAYSLKLVYVADRSNAAGDAEEDNGNDQHLDHIHECGAEGLYPNREIIEEQTDNNTECKSYHSAVREIFL